MARILFVDDDISMTKIYKMLLEDQGHHVDSASNGKEALEILEKFHFDLLITDLNMPLMQGDELSIKARKQQPNLFIILMSTQVPMQHQANTFLSKPFGPSDLLLAVNFLLKK